MVLETDQDCEIKWVVCEKLVADFERRRNGSGVRLVGLCYISRGDDDGN